MRAAAGTPLERIADQLGSERTEMARSVYVQAQGPHIAVAVDPMDRVLDT